MGYNFGKFSNMVENNKDNVEVAASLDNNEHFNKINEIKNELNSMFLEKEFEIEMIFLAILSESNAFMQGPPGTAKSQITEEICKRRIVGSTYFRTLLSKTTDPEDIFGQTSLIDLQKDVKRYITDGKLPKAEFAFLDETFKANSAVLNSLLTIMNEKIFFNNVIEKCPLITVIGASNEYADDSDLVALYDRFLLRWPVSYVKDASNRITMFNNYLHSRASSKVSCASYISTISIDEIKECIESVRNVKFTQAVLKTYNTLLTKLTNKLGLKISDRRKNESLKVIQAKAFLEGRTSVSASDFSVLRYTLWEEEKDLEDIMKILEDISNQEEVLCRKYKEILTSYKAEIELIKASMSKADCEEDYDEQINLILKATDIKNSLNIGVNKLTKALENSNSKDGKKKISVILDEVTKYKDIVNSLMLNFKNS